MLQEVHELKVKQLKVQQDLERDFLKQKYGCLGAALEENELDGASIRSRISDSAKRKMAVRVVLSKEQQLYQQ